MPCDKCCQFDGEFISCGGHIIRGEVEELDGGISIQSIHDIARPLVGDVAGGEVQVAEVVPVVDHIIAEELGGLEREVIRRQVQISEAPIVLNVLDQCFKRITEGDRRHQINLIEFVFIQPHQLRQTLIKACLH